MNLKRLTRDLMAVMQADSGMPVEWVAVAHFNTEHPHSTESRNRKTASSPQPRFHPRGAFVTSRKIIVRASSAFAKSLEFNSAEAQRRDVLSAAHLD